MENNQVISNYVVALREDGSGLREMIRTSNGKFYIKDPKTNNLINVGYNDAVQYLRNNK